MILLIIFVSVLVFAFVINESIRQNKAHKKAQKEAHQKNIENELITILEQEGFSGLDGAIDLWNLDREDDALAVYKQYYALYDEAVQFVTETRKASISSVQRRLKIGYNRAATMIEDMEAAGVVSAAEADGSRVVLGMPTLKKEMDVRILQNKLEKIIEQRAIVKNILSLENELEKICLEIVWNHKNTILKKHKQLVIIDDYGRKLTEQWEKEKDYFLKNVIFNNEEIIDIINKVKNYRGSENRSQDESIFKDYNYFQISF